MDRFARQKELPVYWYNCASDLHGSAAAVWYAISSNDSSIQKAIGLSEGFSFQAACYPVFRMLCGLSIELLCKAIIVGSGFEPKQTHKLNRLAQDARLNLDPSNQKLLDVLTEYVSWAGKYPIPKGDREQWEKFVSLVNDSLADTIPFGRMKLLRPNKRLDWDGYLRLWSAGIERYWEECA